MASKQGAASPSETAPELFTLAQRTGPRHRRVRRHHDKTGAAGPRRRKLHNGYAVEKILRRTVLSRKQRFPASARMTNGVRFDRHLTAGSGLLFCLSPLRTRQARQPRPGSWTHGFHQLFDIGPPLLPSRGICGRKFGESPIHSVPWHSRFSFPDRSGLRCDICDFLYRALRRFQHQLFC